MKIIDTHQHLWDLSRFSYSWCEKIPALNRSFTMGDYLAAVGDLDVARTVHLEADVDEQFMLGETKYILDLAAEPDNPLAGVVACARPEGKDFPRYLEEIVGTPFLKGLRRVLHTQPDELIRHPTLRENINTLADDNLSFDLCVRASQLPLAIKLVEACPRVTFILDHCGNPPLTDASSLAGWRRDLSEMARLPHVVCKISGLVT
ncbi:MAG TPA: amidohydrolase family protein, partial [Pyrinomonadaceae bacterium]|nr:amidohydrolase family protein [Pyrinomonadaceae bacterium]